MNYICAFILLILLSDIFLVAFLKRDLLLKTDNVESEIIIIGLITTLISFASCILMFLTYWIVDYLFVFISYEQLWYLFITSLMLLIIELAFKKQKKKISDTIRYYIPLVTINAMALSTCILNYSANFSFLNMLMISLGSGLGLTFVVYCFSLIKRQLKMEKIPKYLQGVPIYLIIAIIMTIIANQCCIYL